MMYVLLKKIAIFKLENVKSNHALRMICAVHTIAIRPYKSAPIVRQPVEILVSRDIHANQMVSAWKTTAQQQLLTILASLMKSAMKQPTNVSRKLAQQTILVAQGFVTLSQENVSNVTPEQLALPTSHVKEQACAWRLLAQAPMSAVTFQLHVTSPTANVKLKHVSLEKIAADHSHAIHLLVFAQQHALRLLDVLPYIPAMRPVALVW